MKIVFVGKDEELAAADEERVQDLVKAFFRHVKSKGGQIDQSPKKLDYAVLQSTVDRSKTHVERIKRQMVKRISAVLKES